MAWPLGLLSLAGLVSLCLSIAGLVRLFDPASNAFTVLATQEVFRFTLTKPGAYEIGCTRPGRWGNGFQLPAATLEVRPLPTGPRQEIAASSWHFMKRSNMSGETTLRFGGFTAPGPGEYELRNFDATLFKPGDRLRILPDPGLKPVLFILALVASGFALVGGLVLACIAAQRGAG